MPAKAAIATTIRCGAVSPDPAVEARAPFLAPLRPTTYAGCERESAWWYMYRCVDCGRWFHQTCIAQHFRSSAEAPY